MPRYHFHIRDELGLIPDFEGIECPDLTSALWEAQDCAREFLSDGTTLPANMRFEITEEASRAVLNVPIRWYRLREAKGLCMQGNRHLDAAAQQGGT